MAEGVRAKTQRPTEVRVGEGGGSEGWESRFLQYKTKGLLETKFNLLKDIVIEGHGLRTTTEFFPYIHSSLLVRKSSYRRQ